MFIGIKIYLNTAIYLSKLRPYLIFKFMYPEKLDRKEFMKYFHELIGYDPIIVPDDKKLEYLISRMRNMNFPEGVSVEYKGKTLTV